MQTHPAALVRPELLKQYCRSKAFQKVLELRAEKKKKAEAEAAAAAASSGVAESKDEEAHTDVRSESAVASPAAPAGNSAEEMEKLKPQTEADVSPRQPPLAFASFALSFLMAFGFSSAAR